MSMVLMVSAMKSKVGNPLRKLVLIKLADNANDDGECWPSYKNIADQCEISKSSVKNHIRELEKTGFLNRVYRKQGTLNKSNLFRLTLGQQMPQGVGQEMPESEAGYASGGGAGDAPRTSHSFEPVNEPEESVADKKNNPTATEKSAERIANYLHKRLVDEVPQAKNLNPAGWVKDIDRAIRLDEITESDFMAVIDWMHTGDKFWVGNIQSGKKLRKQYLTMAAQMQRTRINAGNRPVKDFSQTDYTVGTEGFVTDG